MVCRIPVVYDVYGDVKASRCFSKKQSQHADLPVEQIWLVVWNMTLLVAFSWEFHHPNSLTHIFQRGRLNQQPDDIL